MREVKEWLGKTDNHMPPATVRARIYLRDKGICHICGLKIDPGRKWIPDHVPPLADGGQNRESMIFASHERCHQALTGKQNSERAPLKVIEQKHIGARPDSKRPMNRHKTDKPSSTASPSKLAGLPPRRLYGARIYAEEDER